MQTHNCIYASDGRTVIIERISATNLIYAHVKIIVIQMWTPAHSPLFPPSCSVFLVHLSLHYFGPNIEIMSIIYIHDCVLPSPVPLQLKSLWIRIHIYMQTFTLHLIKYMNEFMCALYQCVVYHIDLLARCGQSTTPFLPPNQKKTFNWFAFFSCYPELISKALTHQRCVMCVYLSYT